MKEIYEYEHGLPEYLQHDLDMYKEGLRTNSNLLDCYWGELYGSVNLTRLNRQAAIDGASISAQASPVPAALGSMEYLTPDTASTQSVVTRLVSHPLM